MKEIIKNLKDYFEKIENWEEDLMLGYIKLKELEKELKDMLQSVNNDLFSKLENYDLDNLPLWYTGRVQNKIKINYASIPEYAEKNKSLKEYEKLLKQAVYLSLRNKTLNDEDWVLVPVPELTQSSSFVLTKKENNFNYLKNKNGKNIWKQQRI